MPGPAAQCVPLLGCVVACPGPEALLVPQHAPAQAVRSGLPLCRTHGRRRAGRDRGRAGTDGRVPIYRLRSLQAIPFIV